MQTSVLSPAQAARQRVSLDGDWRRRYNGELLDLIPVPSSQKPLGFYTLERTFRVPERSPDERVFLCFEGVSLFALVSVNGARAGSMGPYAPYEFDVTPLLRERENQLEVEIADLSPAPDGGGAAELAIGHNPGWEASGGIIRTVYLEVRPATFLSNARLSYQLDLDRGDAECALTVFLNSTQEWTGEIEFECGANGAQLASGRKPFSMTPGEVETEFRFPLKHVSLWSPQHPNLYQLAVRLRGERASDQWATRTGFRRLETKGTGFLLNGEPLVLAGVCRHDMWDEQGLTLTLPQIRSDMRMIKDMGANFVRLVHYPHDRRVVETADEIGLLVTEEPGYWHANFETAPREQVESGLQTLERTIRRDWNSPSLMAWFLANESTLTVEYLREGKKRCRSLDPLGRFVSSANDMPPDRARPLFEAAEMDFFTQHPYGYGMDKFEKTVAAYGKDRPLVLTEWGWEVVGGRQVIVDREFDPLLEQVEKGAIAGHAFWSWQDMREYSRVDWATKDGVLLSGVVHEDRTPRLELRNRLARLFARRSERAPVVSVPSVVPLRTIPWAPGARLQPVDLQAVVESETAKRSWEALERALAGYWPSTRMAKNQWVRTGETFELWSPVPLRVAGAALSLPVFNGRVRPIAVTHEAGEIVIPVDLAVHALHIAGNVTMPEGYPLARKHGEPLGAYRIECADGNTAEIPLRHGMEVAQANQVHGATRIEVRATGAAPVLEYVKDPARERLQILLFTAPAGGKRVRRITASVAAGQPPLLIFALLAETSERSNA